MKKALFAVLMGSGLGLAGMQPSSSIPEQPGLALGSIKFSTGTAIARGVFRVEKGLGGGNNRVSGRFTYEERAGVGQFSQFSMNVDDAVFAGNGAIVTGVPTFASSKWRNKRIVVHLIDSGPFSSGAGDLISVQTTAINASRGAVMRFNSTQVFRARLGGNFSVQTNTPVFFPF